MIVFTDEEKKMVHQVETEINKTVSIILKFNPRTRRFLADYYEYMNLITAELTKGQHIDKKIDYLDTNELEDIVEAYNTVSKKIMETNDKLVEELFDLLDLKDEFNDENGVFSTLDVYKIWELVLNKNTNKQNQNLQPDNIEKKN